MGYEYDALVLLITEHKKLTREKLIELNKNTFRAQHLNESLDYFLEGITQGNDVFLEFKNGEYCLREGADLKLIQKQCSLGAEIAFNNHGYKPSFWEGDVSLKK
jgi:hypothetical protein